MSENPFVAEEAKKTYVQCKFCKQIMALPMDKRKMFVEAMERDTLHNGKPISTESILAVITDWGVHTQATRLYDHRRTEDHRRSDECTERIKKGWGVHE